jgi:hypothetical protein
MSIKFLNYFFTFKHTVGAKSVYHFLKSMYFLGNISQDLEMLERSRFLFDRSWQRKSHKSEKMQKCLAVFDPCRFELTHKNHRNNFLEFGFWKIFFSIKIKKTFGWKNCWIMLMSKNCLKCNLKEAGFQYLAFRVIKSWKFYLFIIMT